MQFSLTAGVQRVKASRASLMAYSGMIFAVVWDVSIWHHFPGMLSLLGITLIIGNAIIILKFKPQKEDSEKQSQQTTGIWKETENTCKLTTVIQLPCKTLS